jgi:hypothetical protein
MQQTEDVYTNFMSSEGVTGYLIENSIEDGHHSAACEQERTHSNKIGWISTVMIVLTFSLAVASMVYRPINIAVVCLAFFPGVFTLFWIYWRENREDAELDQVIKMFFCGFAPGAIIAALVELVLQVIIATVCLGKYSLLFKWSVEFHGL